jgi:hypothetical protein
MILKLDIEVKRLSIEQANECDKDTLCFDFGRIIGVSGGGGESLWEIGEGDILLPKEDRTFTIKKAYEVEPETGSTDKYLNEQGDFTKPINTHEDLTDKNAETDYQHVDTTENVETFDKVVVVDAEGNVVVTDKANVGGGGSTDIISTNANNATGTIVIDTTPNWQRVNINGGGNTLILDYENGTLPTKNREYLLVINNSTTITVTLTLPTVSFVKGGITYNFTNTAGGVPIDSDRSIEVNVIFFFIDATTCNIRTQITQFI